MKMWERKKLIDKYGYLFRQCQKNIRIKRRKIKLSVKYLQRMNGL